jgi:eukaryotic-like serine/threonine-protein kinase
MLRLIGFGGLTLLHEGRPVVGAMAGRRRLALFALLTASGPRGIDRDTLAELLWPDSEPALGRHSLHQLIHEIRRAHGTEELLAGAPTLHLDPTCITSDVWDFENAVRRRDLEAAVALYRGPFADRFVVPGTDELQRRLDASRIGYAREYTAALEALARDAASRGDGPASLRWWRLLADAEPLSARVARAFIEALVTANEPTQALQFAVVHESLVRQELDSPPDPEIAQWIVRLRATHVGRPPTDGHARVAGNGASTRQQDEGKAGVPEGYARRLLTRLTRAVSGAYHVDRLIDEGSITARYSAVATTGTRAAVEIHVIQPRIAAMANVERFTAVLGKVVKLAHRHIHPTLAFEVAEELLFYVTAPRSSLSLRDRLARERQLSIPETIGIAHDVAGALGQAHAHRVLHADLRPKHVDLTRSGAVLSSLGVIDAITPDDAVSEGSVIVTFGSPSYLSPEQLATGATGDARSDVYAFGCIVYEMLTGEPPFGRASLPSTVEGKMTQTPPPLRGRRETVPEVLERIVHTCLARVPADRYSSGEELTRALAELLPTSRQ